MRQLKAQAFGVVIHGFDAVQAQRCEAEATTKSLGRIRGLGSNIVVEVPVDDIGTSAGGCDSSDSTERGLSPGLSPGQCLAGKHGEYRNLSVPPEEKKTIVLFSVGRWFRGPTELV